MLRQQAVAESLTGLFHGGGRLRGTAFFWQPAAVFKSSPEQTILLGSFRDRRNARDRFAALSNPGEIAGQQAADLHIRFTQHILCQYSRITISTAHRRDHRGQAAMRRAMIDSIARHRQPDLLDRPGGAFSGAGCRGPNAGSRRPAVMEKVVFVPGDPFYTTRTEVATMRLNFSCADAETIEMGIIRLRRALANLTGR
jgi:2-aminoadipate transaminase